MKTLNLSQINHQQQQCKNNCIYGQENISDKHINNCLKILVVAVPVY